MEGIRFHSLGARRFRLACFASNPATATQFVGSNQILRPPGCLSAAGSDLSVGCLFLHPALEPRWHAEFSVLRQQHKINTTEPSPHVLRGRGHRMRYFVAGEATAMVPRPRLSSPGLPAWASGYGIYRARGLSFSDCHNLYMYSETSIFGFGAECCRHHQRSGRNNWLFAGYVCLAART
jgi:hypothetical protein